jgi:Peptidase A4 family
VDSSQPDLQPSPHDPLNRFHTFVGLGFLDVHVDMTVDPQGNVTSSLPLATNLAVRPGDVLSASLCLNAPTSAAYFLANETTGQTVNFAITGDALPPATFVNAGISRFVSSNEPPDFHPLARFGITYFDEISAYTLSGPRSLTSGQTITMVGQNGRTLAMPERLTDFAFRSVFFAA